MSKHRGADGVGPTPGYRVTEQTPAPEPSNPIQSATRTMEIIEVLKERNGATVGELADSLELSKGTVSNYVSTLRKEGFVTKLDTNEFAVGLRVLDVCNKSIRERELYTEGKPTIDDLADRYEGVFTVMAVEHGYGYCLYSHTTSDIISKNRLSQGTRRYLHCNGPGLVILSGMADEQVAEIVDRYGLLSCDTGCEFDCPLAKYARELPVERESLYERLDRVTEQGYALTDHGQISCLGVPIYATGDQVVGAVGVLAPRRTIYDDGTPDEDLIEDMKDGATAIGINVV
jgi:DNA-binding IclR family transcriptional regulator